MKMETVSYLNVGGTDYEFADKKARQDVSTKADKTALEAVASGSPAGVYDNLNALQGALDTDKTRIYLTLDNGNWNYWNGSTWVAGGIYQATEIQDKSISAIKLDFMEENLITKENYKYNIGQKFYIKLENEFDENAVPIPIKSSDFYLVPALDISTTDFIPIKPNKEYSFYGYTLIFYDNQLEPISYIRTTGNNRCTVVSPENAYFARASIYYREGIIGTESENYLKTTNEWCINTDKINLILPKKSVLPAYTNFLSAHNNATNLFTKNAIKNKDFSINISDINYVYPDDLELSPIEITDSNISIRTNTASSITDFIKILPSAIYKLYAYKIIFYDENMKIIAYAETEAEKANTRYIKAPLNALWAKVAYYSVNGENRNNYLYCLKDLYDINKNVIDLNNSIEDKSLAASKCNFLIFSEGKYIFDENIINLQNNDYANKSNILYGKKWVACGDSYTRGDFSGGTEENVYDDELGMYKTYPWWIATRNNMNLINEAINGSDFTNIEGASNPFSVDRYKNIPTDTDYITLMFGLNEATLTKEQIGTKQDTTNTTLWGAYNIVFEYFYTNMPYAKIGVIIPDAWMGQEYANAIKNICSYWGISYLDLKGDNIPLNMGGKYTEVSSKAIQLKNKAFKVSDDNYHPNMKAHEFRSTIIENWMRSL